MQGRGWLLLAQPPLPGLLPLLPSPLPPVLVAALAPLLQGLTLTLRVRLPCMAPVRARGATGPSRRPHAPMPSVWQLMAGRRQAARWWAAGVGAAGCCGGDLPSPTCTAAQPPALHAQHAAAAEGSSAAYSLPPLSNVLLRTSARVTHLWGHPGGGGRGSSQAAGSNQPAALPLGRARPRGAGLRHRPRQTRPGAAARPRLALGSVRGERAVSQPPNTAGIAAAPAASKVVLVGLGLPHAA